MKVITKDSDQTESRQSKSILGVVLFIAAALVLGTVVTIWLASRSDEDQKPAATTAQEKQLESDYGDNWRALGIASWEYEPDKATTFFASDDEWGKIKKSRQKEIMKLLWKDIATFSKAEESDVFIMIHSEERRMLGAYDKEHGVISYD